MDLGKMLVNIPTPTINLFEFGLTKAENKINRDMMFIIDGEYNAITTADNVYSNLIGLESVLEQIVATGEPLHPQTQRLVNISLRPAYKTLGLKKDSYLPGTESVGDSSGSIALASLCLEEVKDTIRKMAVKLAKLMDYLWKKIKEFVKHILERLSGVVDAMKNAMERAEKLKDSDTPFEDFITTKWSPGLESTERSPYLSNHILFSINGKCDGNTAEQIIENTVTLLNANRLIIVEMMHSLELLALRNPTQSQVSDEADRLVKEIKDKMNQFTQTERKSEGHQMVWSYGYFHDGYRFKLSEDIGKAHKDDEVRLFNIDLEMVKAEDDNDYKVRVLTKQEMIQIGKETVNLVTKTKEFDRVVPIVEKTLKSTAEKLHHSFVGIDDKEKRQDIMASLQLISDIFKYVKKYLPKITNTAVEVAADATIYVRSSVARYEMNK